MWNTFMATSTEDETINNVFCTNKIFKICGDKEITKCPKVQACVQNGKMFIAVHKTLVVVPLGDVSECSLLNFSAEIDAFTVSQSGSLLVCGLANGSVHGVFMKGVPVFKTEIKEEDIGETKSFVQIQQVDESFLIGCCNGSFYRLQHVDEKSVQEACDESLQENVTCAFDETILKNVILERVSDRCSQHVIECFDLILDGCQTELNNSFNIVAASKSMVHFLLTNEENCKVRLPAFFEGIKKIENLENYVIGLSDSGALFEICPQTRLIFPLTSKYFELKIDDFVVIENSDEDIELLILTKYQENGQRSMRIVQFPSMQCTYELAVPLNSWLVRQQKSNENLYFLASEDINQNGVPQSIEMKILTKRDPEDRLQKLIHRGLFEEAEVLAQQFNLNVQPIYEAKARKFLNELTYIKTNNTEELNISLNKLLDVLKIIENKDFLLAIRKIEIQDRQIMAQYLEFLLKNLIEERYELHVTEIKEQLLRLETLNLIDPYECKMDWLTFVHHPNIVRNCMLLFKTDILTACLIWRRHTACIVPQLNEKNSIQLLNSIPTTIEPFGVIQWLRHFVPIVLQAHPEVTSDLVNWCIQRTRLLQSQATATWPEIGLEFSTNVKNIFENVTFLYSDVRRQFEYNMEKLQKLVNVLQDLSVLKTTYNLILSMDIYVKESIDETAFNILQRVQLGNMKHLVTDFLYPIFMEKGLAPNIPIIKYVHYLIANRKVKSFWIDRAVQCISLLHTEQEKLECTLRVLKSAPVPWDDAANRLFQMSANSSNPLAVEICTEFELQTLKLIKVKYQFPTDSTEYGKLICRIISVGRPEKTNDIADLVKSLPEMSTIAYFYSCFELARRGEIEEVVTFLESLDEKYKEECCLQLMRISPDMLNDHGPHEAENLIELLKLLTRRVNSIDKDTLYQLQNLQILKIKFGIECESAQLNNLEQKLMLFREGIRFIVKNLQKDRLNPVMYIWKTVGELCSSLGLERIRGILEIAKSLKNLQISCALAYLILELDNSNVVSVESYPEFAELLIVQQMGYIAEEKPLVDDPLSYPLAYKLLEEAIRHAKSLQQEIIDLLKWIRIGSSLYNFSAINDTYGKFSSIENEISTKIRAHSDVDNSISSKNDDSVCVFEKYNVSEIHKSKMPQINPTLTIKCISYSLLLMILNLNDYDPMLERLHSLIDFEKIITEDVKNEFSQSLESLVKSKQYNSWFFIAQLILKYQENSCPKILHSQFISMQHKKILRHLLTQKQQNFYDMLAILFVDANPILCLEYLGDLLKSGQPKVNLLILSEQYKKCIRNFEGVKSDRESRMKYFYHMELCKRDVSLKTKPNCDFLSFSHLMKELQNKRLDVMLLEKMCTDFNWDYQTVLVIQVITILKLQQPVFVVEKDALGKEEIIMKSSAEEIYKLCQPYLNAISNNELLAAKLLRFFSKINFYFYELHLCVLEILTYLNALPKKMEIWSSILYFLKHKMVTKRRKNDLQAETDWLPISNEVCVLSKLAKYRFPFQPMVEQSLQSILDPEIDVETCESWFPLIKLHNSLEMQNPAQDSYVLQDYFCMSAVRNSINKYKQLSDGSKADVWHLQPVKDAFLQAVLRITKHMRDISKIISLLYFVTNHAPDGADQVEAAFQCYNFALCNERELLQTKGGEIVGKITRKYPILKTQHLLNTYGLAEERFMQLVENPKDLIIALYNHPSILTPQKPAINRICHEVARLHDLDFARIQILLLQKWLAFHSQSDVVDFEETYYEDLNTTLDPTETVSDEFVARAHYVLSSWDTDKAIDFLIAEMFPVDGAVNTGKQLQMFECFSKLIDESNAAAYIDIGNQEEYVVFKCVHYLKQLGFNFTVEKFKDYDKMSILKKVWMNHASNARALEVIAYISIGFDINVPKIWNGVLGQMVKLNMVKQLNSLVDILSCKTELLNTEGLASAWQCVLRAPLKSANRTRSEEQEQALAKNLFRIQACPLVMRLNIIEFIEDCIRLDRPHMAAILLAFTSNGQKNDLKNMILGSKPKDLRKEIIDLEETGILPVITNYVLNELQLL